MACQKSGPRFHGANRHGDVTVAGNEDDRNMHVGPGEFFLQFQSAQPGHAHVEHHAAGRVGNGALEKLPGRRKKNDFESDGVQEPLDGGADVVVVVDDNDSRVAWRVRRHGRRMASTPMPEASLRVAFGSRDFETAARYF
jgi:hypothetical protein